jgi:hypothetical protein
MGGYVLVGDSRNRACLRGTYPGPVFYRFHIIVCAAPPHHDADVILPAVPHLPTGMESRSYLLAVWQHDNNRRRILRSFVLVHTVTASI